jgi:hypothetical protein
MDEINSNLTFTVSERTKLPVLALIYVFGVSGAKFCPIPVGMVQLLDFVVAVGTAWIFTALRLRAEVETIFDLR